MNILISIAAITLAVLGSIAGYYLLKLHQQNQKNKEQVAQNKAAWQANQDSLIKDIKFIANSMLQEQCEITEGCMRLGYLIPKIDDSEAIKSQFEHVFTHLSSTAHMPIKDAYQALSKKAQFKMDTERLALENTNKSAVLLDCQKLLAFEFNSLQG